MSRTLPEWFGANDDTPLPTRVKVRIWGRQGSRCASCGRRCGIGGERFAYDHIVALANGGPNRESNIRMVCVTCHANKTKHDVAQKALVYRKKTKLAIGLHKTARPMPGSRNSKWKKCLDGRVVRR